MSLSEVRKQYQQAKRRYEQALRQLDAAADGGERFWELTKHCALWRGEMEDCWKALRSAETGISEGDWLSYKGRVGVLREWAGPDDTFVGWFLGTGSRDPVQIESLRDVVLVRKSRAFTL